MNFSFEHKQSPANAYRKLIKQNLKAARNAPQDFVSLSLSQLIPGIAFREVSPYDPGDPLKWSPLERYLLQRDEYPPRKGDPKISKWFIKSFNNLLEEHGIEDSTMTPKTVVVIGDGQGDSKLFRTLSSNGQNEGERYETKGFFMTSNAARDHPELSGSLSGKTFPSWTELTRSVMDLIEERRSEPILIIFDVDKTILMPRLVSDHLYAKLTENAVVNYIKMFMVNPQEADKEKSKRHLQILEACQEAISFEPHAAETNEIWVGFQGDNCVRAVAALAFASELLRPSECAGSDLVSLIGKALIRARIGKWMLPNLSAEGNAEPEYADTHSVWKVKMLEREFFSCQTLLKNKEPTLAPLYRACEHEALLDASRGGSPMLNGHIVDLIEKAVHEPHVVPVAYSNRPSESVGLRVLASGRSRPISPHLTFFETPLKLIYE